MYILVAAATDTEIKPFVERQADFTGKLPVEVKVLITGVGSLAATFSLTSSLLQRKPDLVIQAGIAGSFDASLLPGAVVVVGDEVLGDWGAWENGEWKDVFDIGLVKKDAFPFSAGRLFNPDIHRLNKYGLPVVSSLTVNEMITSPDRIAAAKEKYTPQIESMEGAALHYTCLRLKIPYLQLRAISNRAGDRNKHNWQIETAINQLNKILTTIIEQGGK